MVYALGILELAGLNIILALSVYATLMDPGARGMVTMLFSVSGCVLPFDE